MITRGRNAINTNIENHNSENVKSILKPSFKNAARAVLSNITDNINKTTQHSVEAVRHDGMFSSINITPSQLATFKSFLTSRRELLSKVDRDEISNIFRDYDGTEYEEVNFIYLQNLEYTLLPLEREFLARHKPNVTPRMRYILINWLVRLHDGHNMVAETLYLAIAIMDRFLQHTDIKVDKNNLQLIGITSLFIASKYEETYPPEISDFCSCADYTSDAKDIKTTEANILNTLGFELDFPVPISFLRRLTTYLKVDRNTHNLAKYFLELTIQEYDLATLTGNIRAAISVCLAATVSEKNPSLEKVWDKNLSALTGLNFADIEEHIVALARVVYRQNSPSSYRAIKNKYMNKEVNMSVSSMPILNSTYFEMIARLVFDDEGNPV